MAGCPADAQAMIVDTSALLAVLLGEEGAGRLLEALVDAPHPRMSAANWLELAMIVEERGGRIASLRLDEFVRTAGIEIVPVSVEQASAARNAWRYFGRHKHSARLDFGDCFAYALAKISAEKLLFVGDGFARTDIEPALREP
jgi:ribonuclease VapC